MTTETVRLDTLTPDPQNTRRHDARNLAEITASLRRWGQYRDFVVQRQGMIIRVGNGMYAAMLAMGMTEGTAKILDLTDHEAAALSIMDNRSAELAEWDDLALQQVLAGLPNDLLGVTGFSEDEIGRLVAGMDDMPPPPPDGGGLDSTPPADTLCVVGAYRFEIDRPSYNRLIEGIRQECGFDEDAVIAGIKRRLGL